MPIFTDDRVTMKALMLVRGEDRYPVAQECDLYGVVQQVNYERQTACVYWHTGVQRVHELKDLTKVSRQSGGGR